MTGVTASRGRTTIGKYVMFHELEPSEADGDSRIWFGRAANMVFAYLHGEAGGRLVRENNPDEYFVWALLSGVTVTAGDSREEVPAGSVVIVPPGQSSVELAEAGSVWIGFTSNATDLLGKCLNAQDYAEIPANIAPIEEWPMPSDGYRIRVYDLDSCAPAGKPRCFRHRTALTNFGWPIRQSPRNPRTLSPHTHDDFEQASLFYAGTQVHHMRRAWGRDSTVWMPDESVVCASPAVAISQPPDVHTTQAVTTDGPVGLIDFFAPPRWDFSNVDGMVVNAAEYPLPGEEPRSYAVVDGVYAPDDPRSALNGRAAARRQ